MAHWQPVPGIEGAWTHRYDFRGNAITTLGLDLGGGNLAVFSPGIGVPEAAYAELEGHGKVAALVSPGAFHHMGLPSWHQRFPQARLFATGSGVTHIAKQHKGLPPMEALDGLRALGRGTLTLEETPGKHQDLLAFYASGGKSLLFVNELLANMEKLPSNVLFALLFRLFKAGPGLAFNGLAAKLLGADKRKAATAMAAAVRQHGADVFVPCHGAILAGPSVQAQVLAVLDAAAA